MTIFRILALSLMAAASIDATTYKVKRTEPVPDEGF